MPAMKEYGYYECRDLTYPSRDYYKTVYIYKRGKVVVDGAPAVLPEEIVKALAAAGFVVSGVKSSMPITPLAIKVWAENNGLVVEVAVDEDAFKAARKAYNEEADKRRTEFMMALFEENGVSENPKAALCFSKAWERGHSSGFVEVKAVFEDLVDLIV